VTDYYYHHYHHHHRPLFLLHSSLAGSQKRAVITEKALLIQCSAENFMNTQHVLSTAAFCIIRIIYSRAEVKKFQTCL